ncbi:MAG: hypothetical protein ACREA9_05495, partial [Pyrinomonadaceae bacterium]
MQLPKFNYLLVAIIVALCGSSSLWAQQVPTTQKPALVSEFRKLTGADKVNSSINMTFDIGTPEILSSIVEEDKEITDAQRQE